MIAHEPSEWAEVPHERYFREKAMQHPLWRLMPHWPLPPPRAEIRRTFERFTREGTWTLPTVRPALLVR